MQKIGSLHFITCNYFNYVSKTFKYFIWSLFTNVLTTLVIGSVAFIGHGFNGAPTTS